MQAALESRLAAREALALDPQRRAWEALDAPGGFGLEAAARGYKWVQNQGEVQAVIRLPRGGAGGARERGARIDPCTRFLDLLLARSSGCVND